MKDGKYEHRDITLTETTDCYYFCIWEKDENCSDDVYNMILYYKGNRSPNWSGLADETSRILPNCEFWRILAKKGFIKK